LLFLYENIGSITNVFCLIIIIIIIIIRKISLQRSVFSIKIGAAFINMKMKNKIPPIFDG